MEKKFLKVGNSINFKFNTEGLECDLTPGMVYNIKVERYTDAISLEESSDLSLPSKVYCTQRDERFIDKVINSYNLSESGFTGVMLAGLKGSGKTVMAKVIANKSGLPIINIDKNIRPYILRNLLEKLGDTSVCFLSDELDKVLADYNDSVLLQVLDGSDTKGKHMILFTFNDDDKIEANDYPTTTFEELFEDMNLSSKGTIKPHARSCKENNHKNVKKKAASDDCCCDCCCAGC